jgi:ribosome-binding factor A
MRTQLAHRMKLRLVPQLSFVYDDSVEQGMHLSQLIDQAIAEDAKHPKDE